MKYSVSIVLCALLLFKIILHHGIAIVYIPPTEPVNTPCPSDQNTCFTLNEWIENGTHPFTNGTTVSLQSGIHLINSTPNFLFIQHVSSIILTGHPYKKTTVECDYRSKFGFKFYNVEEIIISNIQFKYCAVLYKDVPAPEYYVTSFNFTLAFDTSQNITINNIKIINGGVLAVIHSREESVFQIYDSVLTSGFLFSAECTLSMKRTSIQNVSGYESFKLAILSALKASFTDVIFWNNSAPLNIEEVKHIEFSGHIQFSWNSGDAGVSFHNCLRLDIYSNTTIEFSNNIVRKNLLHIFNHRDQYTTENGRDIRGDENKVINNTATYGGIVILDIKNNDPMLLSNTQLVFKNNTCLNFEDSHAAVVLIVHAFLNVEQSYATFVHNWSPLSGGVTLISSKLLISNSNAYFGSNEGLDGGGIAMYENAEITCSGNCNLDFDQNIATRRGGAIFVKDLDYIKTYIQTKEYKYSFDLIIGEFVLNFSSNIAEFAGDNIYGGWIDSKSVFPHHFPLTTLFQDNSSNTVTSNPTRVCMCLNSVPLCNIIEHRINIFPGEPFEIEAVAVGQRMGIVPSIVSILESPDEHSLSTGQDVHSVGEQCTVLQFTVSTLRSTYELKLRAQDASTPEFNRFLKKQLPQKFHILFEQFNILIMLEPCPLGYEISQGLKMCLCSSIIDSHGGVGCYLGTYSIMRDEHHWLHATSNVSNSDEYNCQVIIIHDHCPYDYCRDDTDSLNFHLEAPDKQCAFSRSGILCGECQTNLSQVFGTSYCKECSSFMALAIVPITIVAGMLLVGLLMVLNFTVSTGTINGLIFYANIVRANQAVFFPARITNSFLSIFIAWLNLDLGIEVCFYNGLDAYAKTWLQFAFPFYIWLMLIAIIISCYYSTLASKLFGKNPVQVLATLFLLSYAKITRVVITVFSYTMLAYSNGFRKKVWLYDGNVDFLSGKHTILFIAASLIFVLLSVPYTITLVSIQWLQRFSHYHPLFWVHRLMPLFDAYTGPYKPKHRYWTGLLLLVRVIFLPIFSANFTNNPANNLLAITVMCSIILTYLSFTGGIYKSTLNNILEIISILNLLLFSSATMYILYTGHSRNTTTLVSTGSAFIIFIVLVLSHAGQQLMTLKRVNQCKSLLVSTCIRRNDVDEYIWQEPDRYWCKGR